MTKIKRYKHKRRHKYEFLVFTNFYSIQTGGYCGSTTTWFLIN